MMLGNDIISIRIPSTFLVVPLSYDWRKVTFVCLFLLEAFLYFLSFSFFWLSRSDNLLLGNYLCLADVFVLRCY